ncbi:hypothetical protein NQ318_023582 [Aromia moschata]|uniref:Uncharacterized protein n=1 Tax=Aromia moschata TaxID=1265417 RepID=A0AAV8YQ41_9CUCU|nr:hypothetical protein NQ318_023582 [Aromia moschata]
MGLINLKTRMELPNDWYQLLRESRQKPYPFIVIEVEQRMIKKWTDFFKDKFVSKCPFPVQSIREMHCSKEHPRLISYRLTYNGHWLQGPVTKIMKETQITSFPSLNNNEFELPTERYHVRGTILYYFPDVLPINEDKYVNLMKLKTFCQNPDAWIFYEGLSHAQKVKKKTNKNTEH